MTTRFAVAAMRRPGLRGIWRHAAIALAISIPGRATAAANDGGIASTLADGDVIVLRSAYTPPRDTQVGTILQPKDEVAISGTIATRPRTCRVYKTMRVTGGLVPGMDKTYSTNVPGVGVRFYTTQGWAGPWELAPVNTSYIPPPNSSSKWSATAELIITGPISGGTLTSLPSLDVSMQDCYGNHLQYHITIATGSQITASTCLVTTPSIAVTLPPVRARDFSGAGSTQGNAALRIGLNCMPGADVYITLTDATNPGNRTSHLTPAAGSTAGGVAMRLLHNGTPVAYGPDSAAAGTMNQWRVGTSATTQEVSLTAQYVSTGTVTPGMLTGIATFTMSYQ